MMGTDNKNDQNLTVESTETTPTVTVSICSISLDALAYTFVVEGHRCTFLSVRPAIGSSILTSGFAHSNLFF